MKQRNRFRNYISLEAGIVLLIFGLSQLSPEYKDLWTIGIFFLNTVGIMVFESRYVGYAKRASFLGALAFLSFGIIPNVVLRMYFHEVPFEQMSFGPVPAKDLQSALNLLFGLMVICFFIDSYYAQNPRKIE